MPYDGTSAAKELLAAYAQAVADKDVEALLALYAEDAVVFDLWDRWSYDGREAWRTAVTEWFGSLGDERVRVEHSDVRVVGRGAGDVLGLSAWVRFAAESAQGDQLRAMDNRVSWLLRRVDGGWVVAHEHTSAPVEGPDGRVQLTR